jgi:2-hydroxychromene-2-carboxylate isomerase
MVMVKRNPRLFFSFRSPFSWMAVEKLRRRVPDLMDHVEFIPYWEPDHITTRALQERNVEFHYVQMSKAKHLYILQDTKRLVQALNLQMAWPVDVNPRWEIPHLGWLKARRLGCEAQFYTAVTNARWQRGANICDPNLINAIAASLDLDGEAIARAIDDPEIRADGVECLTEAYEDDIFGVPYMRIGPHRFWGFDRVDNFLEVLLSTLDTAGITKTSQEQQNKSDEQDVPVELQMDVGAYDKDSAGGCG